jgi:hypothetical protein
MSTFQEGSRSIQRLSRVQQLTLTTWRLAAARLERSVDPCAVLEQAALHAVLGALRNVDQPLALFARHATADAEVALVQSLVQDQPRSDLVYDILDAAFLLRWNELVANGTGPEELPPLRPRSATATSQSPAPRS